MIAASAFQASSIQIGNVPFIGWLSGDTAVSPSHRNQKLANPLLQKLIDSIQDGEIAYAIVRNVKSVKAGVKAGMYFQEKLSYWVRPPYIITSFKNPGDIAEIKTKQQIQTDFYYDRKELHFAKDANYLSWRYIEHPCFEYIFLSLKDKQMLTTLGFGVFRITKFRSRRVIVVMDLHAISDSHARALYDAVQKMHPGLWLVSLETGNTAFYHLKCSFVRVPDLFSPGQYELFLYSKSNSVNLEAKSRPWYISTGDWDGL